MTQKTALWVAGFSAVLFEWSCSGEVGAPMLFDDTKYSQETPGSQETLVSPWVDCDSPPCSGPSHMGRLTQEQYKRAVEDIFRFPIAVEISRLPPDHNAGAFKSNDPIAVSNQDIENYADSAGRLASVAAVQVTLECDPDFDPVSCGIEIANRYATRAYRRPLTVDERTAYGELFAWSYPQDGESLATELVLSAMLQSPHFLYHVEEASDYDQPSMLSAPALANRLSFFLWGRGPDQQLAELAFSGDILNDDILLAQVRRLLADPRAEDMIGLFHQEWLQINKSDTVSVRIAESMRAETTRAAIAAVLQGPGGLRSLLTSQESIVDPVLAEHYGLSVSDTSTVKVPGRAGIFTHGSVMSSHTSDSYTRPIHRGLFFLTGLLCVNIEEPPPDSLNDVDSRASSFDTNAPDREKLDFLTQGSCQSCHSVINPAGYVFEAFDPEGRPVNTTPASTAATLPAIGDVGGEYQNVSDLMEDLAESERVSMCIARKWLQFALRRSLTPADEPSVSQFARALTQSGGDFVAGIEALALSDSFRHRLPHL